MKFLKRIPLTVWIVLFCATLAFAAAGVGISTWTAVTTIATGDLVGITDVSDTSGSDDGTSKKITWGEIAAAPGAIGGTTPAAITGTTITATTAVSITQGADPDYTDFREGTTYGGTYKHRLEGDDYSANYTSPLPGYPIGWPVSTAVNPSGLLLFAGLAPDAKFKSLQVSDLNDAETPSVLTTAETTNSVISNFKSSGADHVFTMDAAHAAGNVIFPIADGFQVDIEPDSGELFRLNGTAMAADEHIQNTSDTLGSELVGYCVYEDGGYVWWFKSSSSDWVQETPP